jgi:hypothetical protein
MGSGKVWHVPGALGGTGGGITLDFLGAQVVLVERACPRRTATCGSAGRKCRPSRSADPGARPRPLTPKVEPRSHHRRVDCSENLPTDKVLNTRQHRCLWSAMPQHRRDTQGLADQELRNDRDPVLADRLFKRPFFFPTVPRIRQNRGAGAGRSARRA